jgi:2-polyprenyl-6-methoxyphenol hydroxylase-like FAD-dependent oxidoreductase
MRTAVVVGAGIGGLAVSGALARAGWQVTLIEKEDRLRPGRAALMLWPNGIRAMRALGLGAGLDGIATPVPPLGIQRPDGQWLLQPAQIDGERPMMVHHEDLHDAFIAGLGERVEVRTGVEIRNARPIQDRPSVTDGQHTFDADLVIVADGAASAVRKRLAPGTAFTSAGFAAFRAVIPWYRAPELPRGVFIGGETLGAGHRFISASLGDRGSAGSATRGGIYWVATVPGAQRPEPPEAQLTLLRRWFAGWHAPIPALLAATEPGDLVHDAVGELNPLPPSFVSGGYVLMGDAAHAMTHHLGQGGCLALEDAATLRSLLVEAIPGRSLGDALDRYNGIRRTRVMRVLVQSRRAGSVLQARGRLAVRARDMALGRLAPRMLERAATAASDWQPLT